LGASDSWSDEQVAALRLDINYTDFHLPHTAKEDPATFQRVFHTIIQQIDQGLLKPLPHRTFPIQEAVRAFRTMAQAKHIGKIVITSAATMRPNNNQAATAIGPDKTYLITGGLGGLGLKVAAWLVAEGARSLVLLGRSHPSALAAEQIRHFESVGAQTVVAQVDVADDEQMVALMEQIGRELPPLRGVVHAAGVLDDGMLPQQTWSRFEQVMRPKVAGAWVLHHLTEQQPLDFFVLFSSTASLLGGPALGSYAAANAFLDGLAHYRQERGLPALTINWGPWSEVGMAASLDTAIQQQRARRGMGQILPDQGLYLLGQLISQGIPQAVVMPIDWGKYLQQFPETPKFFSRLAAEIQAPDPVAPSTATTGNVLIKLATAPHAERQQIMIHQIRDRIGRLLGVTAQSLDQDRSLLELGVDSLTVLELRNRILADFKIDIPIVYFMEGPPISTLANMLLEALEQQSSHAIEPISSTVNYQQQDYHQTDNDWEEGTI
jgi:myxalamid-type polyketide synthase MxaB